MSNPSPKPVLRARKLDQEDDAFLRAFAKRLATHGVDRGNVSAMMLDPTFEASVAALIKAGPPRRRRT